MTREQKYINNLSAMIQKETITLMDENEDHTKFYEFHDILRGLFPNIFGACEFEDFGGSILLRWTGSEPEGQKELPVLFMNHMDVVEATGEWKYGPFSGEVHDGKLWGRGTVDTKGGLFAMLQAADELAEEGFVPKRDIYFESACTEEGSGLGADRITDELKRRGIRLEMTFDEGGMAMYDPIGGADGTFAMVGLGEKGSCQMRFVARSGGGHASTPPKDTPLVRLGKFMAEVDKHDPFEVAINPIIKTMFRDISPYMGRIGFVLGHPDLFGGLIKKIMPALSPMAGAMLKTTIAFTMARGSEGNNVIPQEAYVVGDMRFSHHQGREGSLAALKPIADKYNIEIDVFDPGFTSGLTSPECKAFKLVEEAVKATMPNVDKCIPYVMTGASDSRYMDKICDQCIRFLPYTVDDQQVSSIHGLNENIDVDTLVPAVDYYRYMIKNF